MGARRNSNSGIDSDRRLPIANQAEVGKVLKRAEKRAVFCARYPDLGGIDFNDIAFVVIVIHITKIPQQRVFCQYYRAP